MVQAQCCGSTARLQKICSGLSHLYTTNSKKSRREKCVLFFSCFSSSCLLSTLLFLLLHFSFKFRENISIPISCVVCVVLTPATYFSQKMRCFGILLLISMSLKQVKSLLLTLGSTVVIFFNVQNVLRNIRLLGDSLLCNLEAKRFNVNIEPFGNYVQMLKWVGKQLKAYFVPLQLGTYHAEFKLKPKIDSEDFRTHLLEARRALNQSVRSVLALTGSVSSIGHVLSPVLALLLLLLLTASYLKRFHADEKYNNKFITSSFQRYDDQQKRMGRLCVLPLRKSESERYVVTPSVRLTVRQWKRLLKAALPILSHCVSWMLFVGLDVLVYCFIVVLSKRLEELEPLHVPIKIQVKEALSFLGIALDESSEAGDFSYTVSVMEKKCLPEPELWLHGSLVPLVVLMLVLMLLVLLSSHMLQLRVLLSEQFFSGLAEKRAAYLHAKILRKRSKSKAWDCGGELKTLLLQPSFWFPIIFKNKQQNVNASSGLKGRKQQETISDQHYVF